MSETYHTRWDTDEPNLISAKRKNDSGLCCLDKCNNPLSDPPDTGYGGLKVCKSCRASLDELCKAIQDSYNRECDKRTLRAVELLLGIK